ncbi:MAG: hypothetical protein JSU86_09190 [Phycisphaerales bacterium]|nr:MAG: hypothetical protein JSU86_09190 [Phycisphaerales bacterium]
MLYRTLVAVITLTSLLSLIGLSACHRDKPEEAEETPRQEQTPPAPGASAGPEASSPRRQEPTPPLTERQTPASAPPSPTTSETASAQAPPNLLARPAPASDNIPAELEQEMLAHWEEIRSVSAKLTTKFDRLGDRETHQNGLGVYNCLKRKGKILVRTKLSNAITAKQDDPEVPWLLTEQRVNKYSDGQFVHIIDERYKRFTVTKRRAVYPYVLYIGGKRVFRFLRRLEGLQRLPNETIDDKDIYVFEGTLPGARRKVRVYLDKETGIMRQMVTENETSESTLTFAVSEVKLNVEFSEDHFVFVPPDGVEVQDLTIPLDPDGQAATEP